MKFKHVLLAVAMTALPFAPLAIPRAHADIDLDTNLGTIGEGAGFDSATDQDTLLTTVGAFINVLLGFLGVIFLILIIYAGLLWMTAGGSEDNVKKATQILLNSVIGLVILLSAYAISQFVIGQIGDAVQSA